MIIVSENKKGLWVCTQEESIFYPSGHIPKQVLWQFLGVRELGI